MKPNQRFLFLFLASVFIFSCRFKPSDRPNWDVDVLAPLLKSSVSLRDAVSDSLVKVNPDNSLTLVVRDTLIDFRLSDYLEVPDTNLSYTVRLDSIQLSKDSIQQRISLGQLATQAGFGVILGSMSPGNTLFMIPGFNGITSPPTPIDASAYFQQADINSGTLDIEIHNNLPVDLKNIIFKLRNTGLYGNTDTIVDTTITVIPAGAISTTQIPMAGKTIESSMEGWLANLDVDTIPAGTPIDTANQHVLIKIKLKSLQASSATAIFPEQTVINNNAPTKYYFGEGVYITKLGIKSGDLIVQAVNTVQNPLEFIYELPTARRNGLPIRVVTYLDAALPNIPSVVDTVVPLAGCFADLTLIGDSVNIFPQKLLGNMKYSGNLVTMTLQDSIKIYYALKDIIPNYVEGYIGTQTFSFTGGQALDFFRNVLGGTLDLENPKLSMSFINSIGVDGEVRLNQLKGFNSRTGNSVSLSATPLAQPISIPGPRLPNVGQTVSYDIRLDRNNSNVRNFISLLPDSIAYDIVVDANKSGIPSLLNNFATDRSQIAAIMDMEIPLHGVADQLTLEAKLDLNITDANLSEDIREGGFKLIVDNYYPLEVKAQIFFFNGQGTLVDSLFQSGDNAMIGAGATDAGGVVTQPTQSTLNAFFDNYRLGRLRNEASSAKVRFTMDTRPAGTPVKIYSDYKIDFKLVGDFNYHVGN